MSLFHSVILERGSSRSEASISFDNDLLTHCISVATAHAAMPADPGMHDEKTQVESVESANSQIKIMHHEK